jgi:hypothetical protein
MNKKLWAGSTVLLLSMLACQPVFAIGWREILFIIILAAFLLGPPVYRFMRRFDRSKRDKDK